VNISPLKGDFQNVTMDWAAAWLAAGAATTSGIKLYATILTLGLLQRFHRVELPAEWKIFGATWVLALSGTLCVIEFVADKIPVVDSVWDGIHTFIRVPAGAVLMASAFTDVGPVSRVLAGLLGGGLALTTHSAKASARLAANTSPEPFSNGILSLLEDALTVFLLGLAATHPWLAALFVAVVLLICAVVIYTCFKFTRLLFNKLSRWFGGAPATSA
jgi:uncharacterized protein DUF4126